MDRSMPSAAGGVRKTDREAEIQFIYAMGMPNISLDDLGRLARSVKSLADDVTRAATGGNATWVLTALSLGSVNLAVAPSGLNGNAGAATFAIFNGLRSIEDGAERPPFFSERALRVVGSLGKLSRNKGLKVTALGQSVDLTPNTDAHINEILATKRVHLGSIVGRLDVVSVHSGLRVTVYGQQGEVVPSILSSEMLDQAKEFLGQRVLLTGMVSVNSAGNPLRMVADEIFVMPQESALRPLSSLYGSEPDITGGLSASDYVHRAWLSD